MNNGIFLAKSVTKKLDHNKGEVLIVTLRRKPNRFEHEMLG